ncbi:MAG: hypothetical protein RR942_00475 [Romboutsia sp.]
MRSNKNKLICFLTTFIFLFTYISVLFYSTDVYAQDNSEYIVAESSKSQPKSSGFSSGGSKGFSTKPKSTTIKPDSGGFSSKSNSGSFKSNSNSTVKPDSGNFSTKPKTNSSGGNSSKNYDDYGGNSSRPIFRNNRSYYGGYSNPFGRMMYGFGTSSWIIKVVVIITVIVVIYIAIDYIRSRRD